MKNINEHYIVELSPYDTLHNKRLGLCMIYCILLGKVLFTIFCHSMVWGWGKSGGVWWESAAPRLWMFPKHTAVNYTMTSANYNQKYLSAKGCLHWHTVQH